jgi:hypothetical protein
LPQRQGVFATAPRAQIDAPARMATIIYRWLPLFEGENEWQSGSVTTERERDQEAKVPWVSSLDWGHYVKRAIPEARTRAEAEQAQTKIKRDIFDDKYNRAGSKDFSKFVDDVFVPWAKASKRPWQDDEGVQDR